MCFYLIVSFFVLGEGIWEEEQDDKHEFDRGFAWVGKPAKPSKFHGLPRLARNKHVVVAVFATENAAAAVYIYMQALAAGTTRRNVYDAAGHEYQTTDRGKRTI